LSSVAKFLVASRTAMVEKVTRRQALALAAGQSAASRPPRIAPREQLVNVLEYEAQARLTLGRGHGG
jgi:hypothetical protein